MSRSSFAQRFAELVGRPPVDYLTRWRMQLAAQALRRSDRTVASLAAGLGYSSEAALTTAFKRVMGCPPSHYRRSARAGRPQ